MGEARIRSIAAVDDLSVALRLFAEESANALADLDQEVKRALEWIHHDRKDYWVNEVRQGYDRVAEARANLERRMIARIGDDRPAAMEEKKALDLAKRRLEVAQDKVQAVKRWSHTIEHELQEYVGIINQFATWLQSDHPKAQAVLKRMSQALDAYVNLPMAPEDDTEMKPAAQGAESENGKPEETAPQGPLPAGDDVEREPLQEP